MKLFYWLMFWVLMLVALGIDRVSGRVPDLHAEIFSMSLYVVAIGGFILALKDWLWAHRQKLAAIGEWPFFKEGDILDLAPGKQLELGGDLKPPFVVTEVRSLGITCQCKERKNVFLHLAHEDDGCPCRNSHPQWLKINGHEEVWIPGNRFRHYTKMLEPHSRGGYFFALAGLMFLQTLYALLQADLYGGMGDFVSLLVFILAFLTAGRGMVDRLAWLRWECNRRAIDELLNRKDALVNFQHKWWNKTELILEIARGTDAGRDYLASRVRDLMKS